MTNKVAVPLSIAHGEEVSRVPIGEVFRMWDATSRKVSMELAVRKLEGRGTSRSCMPKDIKVRRGELYPFEN